MKQKFFPIALCGAALILTACGGSSDSDDKYTTSPDNQVPASNLDYTKASDTDLITIPVVNLATSLNNFIIDTSNIAEEIHYSMTNKNGNNSFSCSSGDARINTNKSVTLNNCKDIKFGNSIYDEAEGLTLSGTIFSTITDTDNSEKYDITLNNFSIKDKDGDTTTYDGNIVQYFSYKDDRGDNVDGQYDINKLEFKWTDGRDQEKYTLTNYRLTEKYGNATQKTPASARGNLQGDVEGKKFAVKFDSNLNYTYSHNTNGYNLVFSDANINIQDTTNSNNAIKISSTTNSKALIQTTAKGATLTPRTVDWDSFN